MIIIGELSIHGKWSIDTQMDDEVPILDEKNYST
jgi:hypothetical protein